MTHQIHFVLRRTDAASLPQIRDFETGALRAASDQELLNRGLQRINGDYFSCVEQYRRDDERLIAGEDVDFEPFGHVPVGELIGDGPTRYATLPAEHRDQILQAKVIRSVDPAATAPDVVRASLADQVAAIDQYVGVVDGAVLVDLSSDQADVEEAMRLTQVETPALVIDTIPMADIDDATHIVETRDLEPHRWAGERIRR